MSPRQLIRYPLQSDPLHLSQAIPLWVPIGCLCRLFGFSSRLLHDCSSAVELSWRTYKHDLYCLSLSTNILCVPASSQQGQDSRNSPLICLNEDTCVSRSGEHALSPAAFDTDQLVPGQTPSKLTIRTKLGDINASFPLPTKETARSHLLDAAVVNRADSQYRSEIYPGNWPPTAHVPRWM